MIRLADIVTKVRSKNAGPFWLTIDIFCGSPDVFRRVCDGVSSDIAANAMGADLSDLKRFEIADLNVVKFSLPRPRIQGTALDRDMHGASFANILAEMEIGAP
ncbi:DUF4387 family protein [Fontisubflavum oceani]|uniref:DUF4387 family protein n=1 Tax=Fontisubflavum oceani TaxID=2978973 RepID=UPI0025B5CAC1|nr:DUF4387 family protein [Fontisubflavum oceani]WJY22130.1 DUF4387 family protein [Fontisubflavum oceani]